MRVLIVGSDEDLGELWKRHLVRQGAKVVLLSAQDDAIEELDQHEPDVIILDLVLEQGSAFAIADFASYRHPNTRVIFVISTTFFSDGSIFNHVPNAHALVQSHTAPSDIAAMVQHFAH